MQWAKKKKVLIPALTLFLGLLIGPGALWQWSEHKLETSKHIAKLRHDINEIFFRVLELANEHIETWNDYSPLKYYIDRKRDSDGYIQLTDPEVKEKYLQFRKLESKLKDLKSKLHFLVDDYKALETELASLEDREPRALPVDFEPPPPPKGLSISEQ